MVLDTKLWEQLVGMFFLWLQSGEQRVDLEYFKHLAMEYYLSDDPGALGNFINGKLTYDDWSSDCDVIIASSWTILRH